MENDAKTHLHLPNTSILRKHPSHLHNNKEFMALTPPIGFNFPEFHPYYPTPPPPHSFSPPPPPPYGHPPPPPPPPSHPYAPPPPSHSYAPPPPSHPYAPPPPSHPYAPPPPSHPYAPPPPHKQAPPPPHHPFIPPPPHVLPPPHPFPPPPSPDNHPTVIIIVFVSFGGILFLSLLAFALFCLVKRKKKTKEAEIIHFDEHKHVTETIMSGPHGEQIVVISVEDDVHIDEEIVKTEQLGHGLHANAKSSTNEGNSSSIDLDAKEGTSSHVDAGPTSSDHDHNHHQQLENKP